VALLSTYRLQLTESFGLEAARGVLDYLALGLTDVYLSPIFRATRGSPHHYHVVDWDAVSPALGTPGKPETFDAVDALLRAQSYRLANWRVAAEEINEVLRRP
jgi:maltooligosyltrehalose synthase